MWSFINNWQREIELSAGANSVALDLPDGDYLLVISDALGAAATVWEVVRALVVSGTASLTRGQEGTTAEDWEAGSFIYCSLTAGQLTQLYETTAGLGTQLSSLSDRVTALEMAGIPPGSVRVTAGLFEIEPPSSYLLGWFEETIGEGYTGSIMPASLDIPGVGVTNLAYLAIYADSGITNLEVAFHGNVSVSTIASVTAEGIGTLAIGDASVQYQGIFDRTLVYWGIGSHDWAEGEQRIVTFEFTE